MGIITPDERRRMKELESERRNGRKVLQFPALRSRVPERNAHRTDTLMMRAAMAAAVIVLLAMAISLAMTRSEGGDPVGWFKFWIVNSIMPQL